MPSQECYICLRPCRQNIEKLEEFVINDVVLVNKMSIAQWCLFRLGIGEEPAPQYIGLSQKYIIGCDCKLHAHRRCMQRWVYHNPSCIICRRKLDIYKSRSTIFYEKIQYIYSRLYRFRAFFFMYIVWLIYDATITNFDARTCRDKGI